MKNVKLFLLLMFVTLTATLSFSSCINIGTKNFSGIQPSKEITSRNYIVGDFTGVECSTVVDIKISAGNSVSVSLSAPSNYIDYFKVEVEDGILKISQKEKVNFADTDHIKMSVVMPRLLSVNTSGTGDIDIVSPFKSDSFSATSSGTGDIDIAQMAVGKLKLSSSGTGDIDYIGTTANAKVESSGTGDIKLKASGCDFVAAETFGTGDIKLVGSSQSASFTSSGTGDIEAKYFKVNNLTVSNSGTGDIECHAIDKIEGSAGGTGEIEVYGKPKSYQVSGKNVKLSELKNNDK